MRKVIQNVIYIFSLLRIEYTNRGETNGRKEEIKKKRSKFTRGKLWFLLRISCWQFIPFCLHFSCFGDSRRNSSSRITAPLIFPRPQNEIPVPEISTGKAQLQVFLKQASVNLPIYKHATNSARMSKVR
jgi:hypothetical protein